MRNGRSIVTMIINTVNEILWAAFVDDNEWWIKAYIRKAEGVDDILAPKRW